MTSILQYGLYLLILILLAIPLGNYIGKIMNGEKVFLSRILEPVENFIYKILRVDKKEDMDWKKYAISILVFSLFGFIVLFGFNLFQGYLFLNPEGVKGLSWDLSFNTAVSFITNTNWQAYAGESQLSYLTQMLGLTVQNFASAAVGIAVLFALIRGFFKVKEIGIGNFWTDITRVIIYILLPLSIIVAIFIGSQGVVQNFSSYEEVELLQPITLDGWNNNN